MAKKKAKRKGSMAQSGFSGGRGNIETAEKETPREVEPFIDKATKIEV